MPVSQAPSTGEVASFWGNENSLVSTVLLYSAAKAFNTDIDIKNIVGAATFYPYLDLSADAEHTSPFIFKDGVLLFGDYQFGGHKSLGYKIFYPEDCSSAVGKASGLTHEQVKGIYTGAIRGAYKDLNSDLSGNFVPVASSEDEAGSDPSKIQPGDIYLRGGHTAIISNISKKKVIKFLNKYVFIKLRKQNRQEGTGISASDF